MAKTKAEMAKQIKELEEQRAVQYRAIKEWEEKFNARGKVLDETFEREKNLNVMCEKLSLSNSGMKTELKALNEQRQHHLDNHRLEEKWRIRVQSELNESRRDVHRLTSVLANMAKEARDNDLPF